MRKKINFIVIKLKLKAECTKPTHSQCIVHQICESAIGEINYTSSCKYAFHPANAAGLLYIHVF